MIISWLRDGLGDQMFRYAAGRRLALHLGVEFKICKVWFDKYPEPDPYQLDVFNIYENFATAEEVEEIKKLRLSPDLGQEPKDKRFVPETLNYPDNVVLFGNRFSEKYFMDIADVIRKDFTLKKVSDAARAWEEKIKNDKDVTVSVHFRRSIYQINDDRSDKVGSPRDREKFMGFMSQNYYKTCLDMLSKKYDNLSLYIFSDDIDWVKKNFCTKYPMHYVSKSFTSYNTAAEEMMLMSRCQHHIVANSSFSWWGAWLDPNPDKMVFAPKYYQNTDEYRDYSPDKPCESWIKVEG